ncbi:MAG: RluA family pseudouridine synthase, partial [Gammaproteobacteria bacterium]
VLRHAGLLLRRSRRKSHYTRQPVKSQNFMEGADLSPKKGLQEFRVVEACELLPFLLRLPLRLSRKEAKDLLRFGAVTTSHHKRVRHDTRLERGDIVTIAKRKPAAVVGGELQGLKIIHIDDAIVVVEKPAGLLSMGSEREKERTAHRILNHHLKAMTGARVQQAFIVHRLDRETSGLMMLARNEAVQQAIQANWKRVTKKYQAVVTGEPPESSGTLADQLAETTSLMVRRVHTGGETAITHYKVLRRYAGRSLLELTIETGRKHQIRVQLAEAGWPVLGDRKYGRRDDPGKRLALHSCELTFNHPVTGEPMTLRSALPARLRSLIERA